MSEANKKDILAN